MTSSKMLCLKGPCSLLFWSVIFVCFLTVFCEESSKSADLEKEDDMSPEDDSGQNREMRGYGQEGWHAVHTVPEGATGWIPHDPVDVPIKRRRLRKRKKRPIARFAEEKENPQLAHEKGYAEEKDEVGRAKDLFTVEQELETSAVKERLTQTKRRAKPSLREPWEEMSDEAVRPYVRRKVTPPYQSPEDTLSILSSPGAYFNPISASIQFGIEEQSPNQKAEQNEEKHPVFHGKTTEPEKIEDNQEDISPTSNTANLKELLKQNGGLSLSEILQKKNLSLTELLTGNKKAISVLTHLNNDGESSSTTTSTRQRELDSFDTTKYRRLPPSIGLKKDAINRKFEQYSDSSEVLSDKQLLEAQRKRLALLQSHHKNINNGNSKFLEVTRYEVITEPTTEKRIFVPSHPKLYTAVNYKADIPELQEASTESYLTPSTNKYTDPSTTKVKPEETSAKVLPDTQTKTTKRVVTKTKPKLPITSAKLNKLTTKWLVSNEHINIEEENYPKIPMVPLKPIKIDVKDVLGFQTKHNDSGQKNIEGPFRMSIDLEPFAETSTEKVPGIRSTTPMSISTSMQSSSLTEIVPKLKPFTAKDEILEVLKDPKGREDLARILESKNMTIQDLIEQRERGSSQLHLADIFHNKTKEPEPVDEPFEGRINPERSSSFPVFGRQQKSLFSAEKNAEVITEENNVVVTSFPSIKVEVAKEPFPWKELYPDFFKVQSDNSEKKDVVLDENDPTVHKNVLEQNEQAQLIQSDILTEEDIQRLDDIDPNFYSSASSEHLNVVDEDINRVFITLPSGVKSAIFASLVIVGISLLVFVTILFVFRWTQKKKKRLNYCDSLRPPFLDGKSKKIRTFMAETLGKKKINYYKSHMQSMSDSIWERDSDRKPSF